MEIKQLIFVLKKIYYKNIISHWSRHCAVDCYDENDGKGCKIIVKYHVYEFNKFIKSQAQNSLYDYTPMEFVLSVVFKTVDQKFEVSFFLVENFVVVNNCFEVYKR